MRWLVLIALLTLVVGAKELPVDKPINPNTLKATDPRWKPVETFMETHTPGWFHEPANQVGNYVQESWVRGPGSNNGLTPSLQESPGTGWYRWATLHFTLPETFGLHVLAGHNPNPDGWGVSLWFARGGKSVLADGCALSFTHWRERQLVEKLPLADYYYDFGPDYPVQGERAALPLNHEKELGLLWKDAATFEETALQRLDELEKRVDKVLAERRVQRKTYGPYKNDGIPPPTYLNPLTPDEESRLTQQAHAELERRRRLVRENAADFHRMLTELLPDIWQH